MVNSNFFKALSITGSLVLSVIVFLGSCSTASSEVVTDEEPQIATSNQESVEVTVAFYNVENLFDTKDDPYTQDEWFLPTSETHWTEEKYWKKQNQLAEVIDALDDDLSGPELMGLCEVENKKVVEDLINTNALKARNYAVVHYESPDTRGIDVAAIYDTEVFNLSTKESIFVPMPEDNNIKTRDILYCELEVKKSGEKIHFYVNHWSSRRNGEQESYFKRRNCSVALVNHINMKGLDYTKDNVIIVGDMNDYPTNASIYTDLGAKEPQSKSGLQNYQYQNHENGVGTYCYKGEWGCLDNFIVSEALSDNLLEDKTVIFKEDWMLYENKYGDKIPNKTYGGSNYYGGYSDHLPIYMTIQF